MPTAEHTKKKSRAICFRVLSPLKIYTWLEYMAGWWIRSGTAMPAESREYLDDAASLEGLMGAEIFNGNRAVRRRADRFMGDCE